MSLTQEQLNEIASENDINVLSEMLSDDSPDYRRAVLDKGLGMVKAYSHARRLFYGAPHGTEEEERAFAKVLEVILTKDDFEEICDMFAANEMILEHRDKLIKLFQKADELGILKI